MEANDCNESRKFQLKKQMIKIDNRNVNKAQINLVAHYFFL